MAKRRRSLLLLDLRHFYSHQVCDYERPPKKFPIWTPHSLFKLLHWLLPNADLKYSEWVPSLAGHHYRHSYPHKSPLLVVWERSWSQNETEQLASDLSFLTCCGSVHPPFVSLLLYLNTNYSVVFYLLVTWSGNATKIIREFRLTRHIFTFQKPQFPILSKFKLKKICSLFLI